MKTEKPNTSLLAIAGVITCVAWTLSGLLWFRLGQGALGVALTLVQAERGALARGGT